MPNKFHEMYQGRVSQWAADQELEEEHEIYSSNSDSYRFFPRRSLVENRVLRFLIKMVILFSIIALPVIIAWAIFVLNQVLIYGIGALAYLVVVPAFLLRAFLPQKDSELSTELAPVEDTEAAKGELAPVVDTEAVVDTASAKSERQPEYVVSPRRAVTKRLAVCHCFINTVLLVLSTVYILQPMWASFPELSFITFGDLQATSVKTHFRAAEANTYKVICSYVNGTFLDQVTGIVDASNDYMVQASVLNLEPATEYKIETVFYSANGASTFGPIGEFKTLPSSSLTDISTTQFSFALTSCTQTHKTGLGGSELLGYNHIADKQPDFLMFVGDYIYADVPWGVGYAGWGFGSNLGYYAQEYLSTFNRASVQNALAQIPAFWMYDDHEITNDYQEGNETEMFKAAVKSWNRYLGDANPPGRTTFGYQYSFDSGDTGFYVLDTRYHRDESQGLIIGQQQYDDVTQWLVEQNNTVGRTWKFVVSPVPFTRNDPDANGGWNCGCPNCERLTGLEKQEKCPAERDNLIDFIVENNIRGVVLLSGDTHAPGVFEVAPNLYEVSCSGLDALPNPKWEHEQIDRTVYQGSQMPRIFGILSIQGETLTVDIYGGGPNPFLHVATVVTWVLLISWFGFRLVVLSFPKLACGDLVVLFCSIPLLFGLIWSEKMKQERVQAAKWYIFAATITTVLSIVAIVLVVLTLPSPADFDTPQFTMTLQY